MDGGCCLAGLDLVGEGARSVDRDRVRVARAGRPEREARRGGGVHPDHLALAVQERAAGVAGLERCARLDQSGQPCVAALVVTDRDRLGEAGDRAGRRG